MKSSEWSSVRKIRTIEELNNMFSPFFSKRAVSAEELRQELIQTRVRRSSIYLGLTRKRAKGFPSYENVSKFSKLLNDRISFAKKLGVWKTSKDEVSLTEYGINVRNQLKQTPSESDRILFNLILESPYAAYRCFLERLAALGGKFQIEEKYESRGNEFRKFINSKGFLTDGASFHTIKDLFYDFGLLNWRKINGERIFLTRDLHKYRDISSLGNIISMLTRKIPKADITQQVFVSTIIKAVKNLNLELEAYHDIILIRDEVCEILSISDQKFAELLKKIAEPSNPNKKVIVGVGPLVTKPPMGYSLKLAYLPTIFEGEPITKLMVRTE